MSGGLIDPRPPPAKVGRPRTRPVLSCVCETCGHPFLGMRGNANRFCSPRCYHSDLGHDPKLIALARCYWDMGLSARAIAEKVTFLLQRAVTKNAVIGST